MDLSKFSIDQLERILSMATEVIDRMDLPKPELIKSVIMFRKSLSRESDRGAALMSAAFLENQLEGLLIENLVDNSSEIKEVLGYNSALGSFSSKITLSYLLGLIPLNAKNDLNLIRKIRNDFAHDASPINFSTEKIRNRCHCLVFNGKKCSKEKAGFRLAVMGLLSVITVQRMKAKNIEPMKDHDVMAVRELMGELLKDFDLN